MTETDIFYNICVLNTSCCILIHQNVKLRGTAAANKAYQNQQDLLATPKAVKSTSRAQCMQLFRG